MKNGIKGLTLIFAAVMTVLSLWLLGACGTDGMENVSERRSGYYLEHKKLDSREPNNPIKNEIQR